jgi:outer membrane receptor protein involved in Fe transport
MLDSSRGIADLQDEMPENALRGTTQTSSLFISDTIALRRDVHLTAAARYNQTHVVTVDQLNRSAPNLDGDHRYKKLNPALGLTWQALPALNVYAGFNQGNRAPSPIELGCADPANPCSLPNAMAADPYLKQVVARTVEAGLRGKLVGSIDWNAGAFRTVSSDDILFVGTSTSAGYFTNFGQTRRQGAELGLAAQQGRFDWRLNYSYLHASFQSEACLLAENNSSRGQSAACTADGQDDEIQVKKGNRLPGLPNHSLKFSLSWRPSDALRIGAELQAFSSQFARGNENNEHQAGTASDQFGNARDYSGAGSLPGYATLNLNGNLDLGGGWALFARVNNLFDKRYGSVAALAESPFDRQGGFTNNSDNWQRETFIAPGAPRAAWLGLRYRFAQ